MTNIHKRAMAAQRLGVQCRSKCGRPLPIRSPPAAPREPLWGGINGAALSKFVVAYNIRGIAYWQKGDNDRAIADFDKAIELDPKDANPYYNRGLAYLKKGEHDRAITDLRKALTLDPANEGFKKVLSGLGETP